MKYCPFTNVIKEKNIQNPVCFKEACALYDDRLNQCCIKSINNYLLNNLTSVTIKENAVVDISELLEKINP